MFIIVDLQRVTELSMSAPFGIRVFGSLEEFEVVEELPGSKFRILAPSPHPDFDSYIIQASDSLGIVWIKALGKPISSDAYGTSLRASVDRIAEQVSQKYGTPEKSDFILPGSIWDEPQYWMNALEDSQRYYCYNWSRKNTRLAEDLENVFVGASSYGNGEAGVIVEYSSTKLEEHDRQLESKLADLF